MKRRTTRPSRRPNRGSGKQKIAPARRSARGSSRAVALQVQELDALRLELERQRAALNHPRWNVNPDDAQRSLARLVLTLVEFLRQLMERQAVRRMEAGTLSDAQVEAVGTALMRLEETIREMASRFGIPPEELNLELGPLGRLI